MEENKNPEVEETTIEETTALQEAAVETVEDTTKVEENTETTAEAPAPQLSSKADVIERLKAIVAAGENINRAEVEQLKQAYYKFRDAEVVEARNAFIANGGAAEEFMPAADADEENFKAQMGRIREIRAQALEDLEREKQEGLAKKLEIIEKIKNMTNSVEEADKNYEAFKALQAEWKEVKQVPAEKSTELWKNYQLYVEQFYDQLRLNHEFRIYDFKKNLE